MSFISNVAPPHHAFVTDKGQVQFQNNRNEIGWSSKSEFTDLQGRFRLSLSSRCSLNLWDGKNRIIWSSDYESLLKRCISSNFDSTICNSILTANAQITNGITEQVTIPDTISKNTLQFNALFENLKTGMENYIRESTIDKLDSIHQAIQKSQEWWMPDISEESQKKHGFFLCSPQGQDQSKCLFQRDANNKDPKRSDHLLKLEAGVNLEETQNEDYIAGSIFTELDKGELRLLKQPKYCFAFNDDDGNVRDGYLAYRTTYANGSIASECYDTDGYRIGIVSRNDSTFEIVDWKTDTPQDRQPLCMEDDLIVSTMDPDTVCNAPGYLRFTHKIYAPYNSKDERIPFSDLGGIAKNYPLLATIDLIALKEKFLRTGQYGEDFDKELNLYKSNIDYFIQTLNGYQTVKNTKDFDQVINGLNSFKDALNSFVKDWDTKDSAPSKDAPIITSASSSSSSYSTSSTSISAAPTSTTTQEDTKKMRKRFI